MCVCVCWGGCTHAVCLWTHSQEVFRAHLGSLHCQCKKEPKEEEPEEEPRETLGNWGWNEDSWQGWSLVFENNERTKLLKRMELFHLSF